MIGTGSPPWDQWLLALLGLVSAFWLFTLVGQPRHAAGTGWAVGLGYFGFALGWIVEPFQVDAATTGWMAPFALFFLAGGLALFWGLAFGVAARVARSPVLALVVFWSLAELARGYVFTGFPWALVGYIWASVDAIQWVALVGSYGVTAATLAIAGGLAVVLRDGRFGRVPLAAVAALAVLLGGGRALVPADEDLTEQPVVRLVQPNAPQHEKWDPEKIPVFFDRQVRLTGAEIPDGRPQPSLVVWPETAMPWLLHRADDGLAIVSDAAGETPVVLGIQRAEEGRWYNSAVLLDATGTVAQVYDKHHLVPFGEYMPAAALFARWNIMGLAARAEGGYSPGPGPALMTVPGLGLALPLICYEAVFPQDLRGTGTRPDMVLHLTNDAWFGEFSGPYQHLAQARIRAIEFGLPMLRAANTGVSAVIDGAGRVIAELPLGQAGFVDAALPPPRPVTLYARLGDWPVALLLVLAAGYLAFTKRTKGA